MINKRNSQEWDLQERGTLLSTLAFCPTQWSVSGVPFSMDTPDFLGHDHAGIATALDTSRRFRRHVPIRTSGSSFSVLACNTFSDFIKWLMLRSSIFRLSLEISHFSSHAWRFWVTTNINHVDIAISPVLKLPSQ